MSTPQKDLIVLCADKEAKLVIEALLTRHQAFGIRSLQFDVYSHPQRDAGVYLGAGEFLRNRSRDFQYALVFLDRDGSGHESDGSEEIARQIESAMQGSGWNDRVAVVVFTPELESWLWVKSNNVPKELGWDQTDYEDLLKELQKSGWLQQGQHKPADPKGAIEWALRSKKIPRSPAIYQSLARSVSWRHCQDPWFTKFTQTLQAWFGANKV